MSPQIPEYEVASLQPYIQPIRHRPTLPLELAMAPSSSAVLCLKATDGVVGETVETVSDFIFLGSKITADGDCSHEIKRRLFLGTEEPGGLQSKASQRVRHN